MRAIRRHHQNRLKKKRSVYWGDFGTKRQERRDDKRLCGLKLSSPKQKSGCVCCINPRKYCGPTRQELKSEMSYQELIKEFYTYKVTDEESAKAIIHPGFDKTKDENRQLMTWMFDKYRERFNDFPYKVADYGCGIGRMMDPFIKNGISIDGFDISPSMLRIAKQRYPLIDFFEVNPDGSFVDSPEVRQYDLIYSFLVLQHNCNRDMRLANLRTIHKLLNERGMCIIQLVFSDGNLVSPHHDYDENAEGKATNSVEDNWVRKPTLGDLYEDFSIFSDIEFSFIDFPKGIISLDTNQIVIIATKTPQLFNKIYNSSYK